MHRFVSLAAVLLAAPFSPAADPTTNVVFRNATVYDGSDKPPAKADVHIKGERIVAVGNAPEASMPFPYLARPPVEAHSGAVGAPSRPSEAGSGRRAPSG